MNKDDLCIILKKEIILPTPGQNKEYNISIFNEDFNNNQKYVGYIKLIEIEHLNFDAFDESNSLVNLLEFFLKENFIDLNFNLIINEHYIFKVVFLERIEILEKYRGLGIGKESLNILLNFYKDGETLFCLKSFPLQHEQNKNEKGFKKDLKKLNSFYETLFLNKIDFENHSYFYENI